MLQLRLTQNKQSVWKLSTAILQPSSANENMKCTHLNTTKKDI